MPSIIFDTRRDHEGLGLMFNKIKISVLSIMAAISFNAQAAWHTVQGNAPILDSVAKARDDAVNDAIRSARLEAGALVSTQQEFQGGTLLNSDTTVKSDVPVRKVIVVAEQKTRGRVSVTVKVLLDESHAGSCAASAVKKSVLPITFGYADQTAYQGSAGIDTINRELTLAVTRRLASIPSLLLRSATNVSLHGAASGSAPDQELQANLEALAKQHQAQYIVTGSINSAAAADAGEGVFDKIFYQRTRSLSFTVTVYDSNEGSVLFSRNYDMVSDWPFKQGEFLDLRSERFKGSAFGQRMASLAQQAGDDIAGVLQCRMPEATVIDIDDDGFIIDLGEESGIRQGMKFSLVQTSEGYTPQGDSFDIEDRARGIYVVKQVYRGSSKLSGTDLNDNLLNVRINDKAIPVR